MTTEQYAIGYETGYQDGWNAAMEASPKAEPATQCWKCGDLDPAGHAKCDVPACGMREPAELEPGNWIVYNSGAEVASGLSFAEARDYLTPERLARGWCAVCVVDQSNLPTTPQPAKE